MFMRNLLDLFISSSSAIPTDTHVCTVSTAVAGHLIAGFDFSAGRTLQPSGIKLVEYRLIGRLLHLCSNFQFSQSDLFLESDPWL